MIWKYSTIRVNDGALAVYRAGRGQQIVAVHGITDSHAAWDALAERLADRFEIIAYDARGHGASHRPAAGSYALDQYVADLTELVKALDLAQPVVIGHSMGGATAALTAATSPDLFRRVILEDLTWIDPPTAPPAEDPLAFVAGWYADLKRWKEMPHDELVAYQRTQTPERSEESLHIWATAKQELVPEVILELGTLFRPWRPIAEAIRVPTLVITGEVERGAIITGEVERAIEAVGPHVSVARVPGAGHSIHYDMPDAFYDLVSEFLVRLPDTHDPTA